MNVVIDRARWARGRSTCLVNGDGTACALGFIGEQCGVPESELRHSGQPSTNALWPAWLHDVLPVEWSAHRAWRYITNVNDAKGVSDAWRESYIAKVLAHKGVDVTFIGPSSPPSSNDASKTSTWETET